MSRVGFLHRCSAIRTLNSNSSIVQRELQARGHELFLSRVGSVRGGFRPAVLITLIVAFLTVALIPLFTCSPLPLADYPNHLARMYIITSLGHSPLLQRYYEIHWQLIPNLALDLVVPPLARFMPLEWAMLLFTGITLVSLVTGCFAVHRALFGRLSYAPFAVFLLLYNRQFLWGFLNYLFSLGLALLTFALWVALRRKPIGVRCGIFVILALMVFVSHLAGFGVLGVLIVGYEVHSFLQGKDCRALRNDLVAATIVLGLPAALFLLFSPTRTRSTPSALWELRSRIIGLMDAFNNYTLALDAATFLLVVTAIGVGLLLRKARLHSRMWLPLVSLALIYCVINPQLLGSTGADRRLIPALFLVLACSLEWNVRERYFVAAIGLVFLVRTAVVIKNWSAANVIYSANVQVIDQIPRGVKVAAAVGELNFPQLNNPPVLHLPNMAVIRRQVLINSLFVYDGVQPLRFKPEYKGLFDTGIYSQLYEVDVRAHPNGKGPLITTLNPFERIHLTGFDYLLLVNKRYFGYPVPGSLRPVYSAADTVLYQVLR